MQTENTQKFILHWLSVHENSFPLDSVCVKFIQHWLSVHKNRFRVDSASKDKNLFKKQKNAW